MKKNDAILTESFETEILKQIIEEEKERLKFQKTDFGRKKTQERIMLLENKILPVLEAETVLLYGEITKYVHKYVKKAIELDNDAVLIFLPLRDIIDKCDIALVNPAQQTTRKDIIESMEVHIDNMHVGGREIKISHLDIIDLV